MAAGVGLTPEQLEAYHRDGFLVIQPFWAPSTTASLKTALESMLASFSPPEKASVFTSEEQERTADEYFLGSGEHIRFFFEKGALDAGGRLIVPKEAAVNKIGHNLHELHPAFRAVSLDCPRVTAICRSLGFVSCIVPQSMAILKPPRIGGPVLPHVDGCFLYTVPQTVVGLWWPLEDCTKDNGCLWAVPGSHRAGVARRFKRTADGKHTEFEPAEEAPFSLEGAVPLLTPAGSLVLLHHAVVHFSHANTSDISRYAYSIHVVDGTAEWAADNWLQREGGAAFPKLF